VAFVDRGSTFLFCDGDMVVGVCGINADDRKASPSKDNPDTAVDLVGV